MITDYDLALACEATYSGAPQTWGTDLIHAYYSMSGDTHVIAFEGTKDIQEWAVDFAAVPLDTDFFYHVDLGVVHAAWWAGVDIIADTIVTFLKTLTGPIAITGHSKGAAEALMMAAYARLKGIPLARVSTFGTPHPGYLKGLITAADGCDYWNCDDPHDPVPTVPFYLPRPRPLTVVHAPLPQFNEPDWALLISHHMQNYLNAMQAPTT